MKAMFKFFLAATILITGLAFASDQFASLRGAALDVEKEPAKMVAEDNRDIRQQRDYPMQPPLIPHRTDGYQVDQFGNKCLSCHSRKRTEDSQAPMISVTHYMDRDGNFLADVSPRRYFCSQCHVSQTTAEPLVGNDFIDIDQLLSNQGESQ